MSNSKLLSRTPRGRNLRKKNFEANCAQWVISSTPIGLCPKTKIDLGLAVGIRQFRGEPRRRISRHGRCRKRVLSRSPTLYRTNCTICTMVPLDFFLLVTLIKNNFKFKFVICPCAIAQLRRCRAVDIVAKLNEIVQTHHR